MSYGLQTGWLSPLQPKLQSQDSPLGENVPPLTDEEISWIGSLPSITLILAAPIFGYTMNRFGRKSSLLLSNAPNLVTYLLLIFAQNIYYVYASRIIGGFCSCGAFIVGPIYISETSEGNLKATLGGLTGFFIKLGVILSYILGAYASYLTFNLISMSFTVLFLILYTWIPDSPVNLLTQGKPEEARIALKRLRCLDDDLLAEELRNMQSLVSKSSKNENTWVIIKGFFVDKPLRNAIIIVAGIYTFQMLSGYPAIVRYSVYIFNLSGTLFPSHIASILLAVTQLVSSFFGAFVLDRSGRKLLLIIGLAMMGLCMGIVSVYLCLQMYYPDHWLLYNIRLLPVIALLIFIAAYALAFGCVPFVIIPELFSPESCAMASTILNLWFAFVEFVVAKLFPTLTNIIYLWGSFALFTILNCVGIIFICFVMFETKGLNFSEIYIKLGGHLTNVASLPQSSTKPLLGDKSSLDISKN